MKTEYLHSLAESVSATNYIALLRVLLALPATLSRGRVYSHSEQNAIRRAAILRKKIVRNHHRHLRQKRINLNSHN